ncbi:MAG: ribulose-phosphate 3-epimerase [Spirochaetaceae bacterium]|nr:ribulose-phosphate 3-epimerase [Spirochaetaceae bacterium]
MKKTLIAPSILSADFSNMGKAIDDISASGADWIHMDIMDGSFVPPITFGAKMTANLRGRTSLPFDVHLMTQTPEKHIENFADAGADYITFHLETAVHAHRIVQNIRQLGKKAGISITPSTPVSALECLLPFVDIVLIMTVNPGYGGQSCITECFTKIEKLTRRRQEHGFNFLISVDGGINETTAPNAVSAGADILVTGSTFFNAADKPAIIKKLRG